MPPSLTTALMVREARSGMRVVRLHGGDPFVFGRGGEELDALIAAKVRHEIVPGVSSALAAPALAGVPLTQREIARGFSVRMGHSAPGHACAALEREQETVVVLMGLSTLEETMHTLRTEGWPSDTPAAAIASASLPTEKVVTGTLETLPGRVREAGLESPVTVVIGQLAARARATRANEDRTDATDGVRGPGDANDNDGGSTQACSAVSSMR